MHQLKQPAVERKCPSRLLGVFPDDWKDEWKLVPMPMFTAPVRAHFGFRPNEPEEPSNVNEPATKTGNSTNLKMNLKFNHPT